MAELVGKMLANRYRVDTFIDRGGMAEVYKVWDQQRAVHLAMKVLRSDLAEDKAFLRRFTREGHTLEKLQHPNIVRFYGLEQDGDLAFMLMEFIDGTTLRKVLFNAKRALPFQQILAIMRPVCAALHYAHAEGFVHCDVKPANIMVDQDEDVYLSDFGIARMTEGATTTTATSSGTPAYMAPEQVQGKDPTPLTDFYALGVVLYEMLTGGERPFSGDTRDATGTTSDKILWEHVHKSPPSPRKFNPALSPALESAVMKCLEKDPQKRFQDALDFLQALEKAIGQLGVGTEFSASGKEVTQPRPGGILSQGVLPGPVQPPPVQPPIQPGQINALPQYSVYPAQKKAFPTSCIIILLVALCIGIVGVAGFFGYQYMNGSSQQGTETAAAALNLQSTQAAETNIQSTAQAQSQFATSQAQETAVAQQLIVEQAMTQTAMVEQATQQVIQATQQALQACQGQTPLPVTKPWRVIVCDGFNDAKYWITGPLSGKYVNGSKEISNGVYTWNMTAIESFVLSAWLPTEVPHTSDFFLSVEARIVNASESSDYGLVFRLNPDTGDEYGFFVNEGFKKYQIAADINNEWKIIQDWTESAAIQPGSWNRLTVVTEGSSFSFYINMDKVGEIMDRRLPTGTVGIVAEMYNPNDQGVMEFDNFLLLAP